MTRMILVAAGIALLSTGSALALDEGYCSQVRQAVATYGYANARAHALANYGKEAVAQAESCLRGGKQQHRRTRRRAA